MRWENACLTTAFGPRPTALGAMAVPWIATALLCVGSSWGLASPTPLATSVEYLGAPLGLETLRPRFSWKPTAEVAATLPRSSMQTSYRVRVALSPAALAGLEETSAAIVWDSGSVASNISTLLELGGGVALAPNGLYFWQVGVTYSNVSSSSLTKEGKEGGTHGAGEVEFWSATSRFSIGPSSATLLATASFIGAPDVDGAACPWLRKTFPVPAVNLSEITVLVSVGSYGFHEVWVNGQKATNDVLAPAISDLGKRILLRTYDVTALLVPGEDNVVGLWLARGWADFSSVNPKVDNLFNSTLDTSAIAIAQVLATFPPVADGTTNQSLLAVTDASWRAAPSDTTHRGQWTNADYGGDRVDAALSEPLWSSPALDDATWSDAVVSEAPPGRVLFNDVSEPNRLRERVAAKSVDPFTGPLTTGNAFLVEMHFVFTGWISFANLQAAPGALVNIKVSSVPITGTAACTAATKAGRPYCSLAPEYNMQHSVIMGASGALELFMPRFSYHEVHFIVLEGEGLEAPKVEDVVGFRVGNIGNLDATTAVTGSGRQVVSTFESSDPALNAIYAVTMWNVANLVTGGFSVDCPHRERLGYLGDAHTSLEMALQTMDSGPFYSKWLNDIMDIQDYPAHNGNLNPKGYIAHTAPTIDGGGGPSWSGFVITMPWQLYLTYGDRRVLAHALPAMEALLAFWQQSANGASGLCEDWGVDATGEVIDAWTFLGDWLTPHGSEQPPPGDSTSPEAALFNNCYIVYCTRIVADVLRVLGDDDGDGDSAAKAAAYDAAAASLSAAIHATWFDPATSTYLDGRQAHLVMPLLAGVVPAVDAAGVWASLRSEVLDRQAGHLDVGLQGLYFMTKLMSDTSMGSDFCGQGIAGEGSGCGGADDLLHAMSTVATAPGFLDLLAKGFTTWPEAWGKCEDADPAGGDDTYTDDGPAQPFACAEKGPHSWTSGSQSALHGCLNGLGMWFVAGVGGIRRAAPSPGTEGYARLSPGFQAFEVRAAIGVGGLESASATYDSLFGLIKSSWRVAANGTEWNVTVPPNTRAEVYVPGGLETARRVREGGEIVIGAETNNRGGQRGGGGGGGVVLQRVTKASRQLSSVFMVGSGSYTFTW